MNFPDRYDDKHDLSINIHGRTLRVHRAVVEASSVVLKNLLEKSPKESVIDLGDKFGDHKTIDDVIGYFYDNTITLTPENIASITLAAKALEVSSLVDKCWEFMNALEITSRNVIELFMLSIKLNWQCIQDRCSDYLLNEYDSGLRQHRSFDFDIEEIKLLTKKLTGRNDSGELREALFSFSVRWLEKEPVARLADFKSLLKSTSLKKNVTPNVRRKYLEPIQTEPDAEPDVLELTFKPLLLVIIPYFIYLFFNYILSIICALFGYD